jgi:hypothetical protein
VGLASPNPVQAGPAAHELHWRLEPGALNRLQWHTWRWSRLGLGALAVALILAVAPAAAAPQAPRWFWLSPIARLIDQATRFPSAP